MNEVMSTMSSKIEKNNLKRFKEYLDTNREKINDSLTAIEYNYDLNLNIYSQRDGKNCKIKSKYCI